jgi:Protein of unknown function (DUF3738)
VRSEWNAAETRGTDFGARLASLHTYFALNRPEGEIFAAARNTTMRQLCAFLSNVGGYGRTLVDQSGIAGAIDFGMEYTKAKPGGDVEYAGSPVETLKMFIPCC